MWKDVENSNSWWYKLFYKVEEVEKHIKYNK